jgi:hypothetical protein
VVAWDSVAQRAPGDITASTASVVYHFVNRGTQRLSIQVLPACHCVSAVPDKECYAPGERGTIEAVMNLGTVGGRQTRAIDVSFSDGSRQRLMMTAINVPTFALSSGDLVWSDDDDLARARTVRVTVQGDYRISSLAPAHTRWITVQVRPVEPGRVYDVVVTPKPGITQCELEYVVLKSDHPLRDRSEIAISVEIER